VTWTPRDYQHEAIEAGLDDLAAGEDTLLVVPTGGGKSGIIGTIIRTLVEQFGLRVVSCAHVKELVGQAYAELIGMWDWAPAGIYSAGLGRKEMHSRILFAGIQSIFKKAHLLGCVDVLIIDEVDTLPVEGDGQYRKFIADLRAINPDMRVLGLTATPYRLGHGRIDEPREKKDGTVVEPLFSKVAYEVGLRRLIDDGWLAPLTTKDTGSLALDMSDVGSVGGDYNIGDMSRAVDKPELISAICADIIEKGRTRRSWLIFTPGKSDAHHFHEEMQRRGMRGGVITDDTPSGERDRLIAAFRAYQLRYLINCGILTVGFDHKGVDLIAMVRKTKSARLYVQICGRGTRPLYVAAFNPNAANAEQRKKAIFDGPKRNCLVLDYAKNIDYHGPVDLVVPRRPGKGGGPTPMKTCPEKDGGCGSRILASARECPDCGHEFTFEEAAKFSAKAAVKPILSREEPSWIPITRRNFARHEKFESPASVRVEYWRGLNMIAKEWWAFESEKGAWKAAKEWKACGGAEPAPATTAEALERVGELRPISEIRIEADGKFWRVTGRKFGGDSADEVEKPRLRYDQARELADEEIAF
jgi:DNA repair protein RadD